MKYRYVFVGLVSLALALTACGGTDDSQQKISVVESFLAASNGQEWNDAAGYLAEDVVFTTPTGNSEGRGTWLASVQGGGPGPTRQEASNFTVDGDVVRWEMIVTFPNFQAPALGEALVLDGKIQSFSVKEP